VLTVDFDRLGIGPSVKVIDVGCGAGRHAFEAYRRGADVVAFDRDAAELRSVETILQAMADAGEAPATASAKAVLGDALKLPYADETFDCVIASEILEHVPQDDAAIAELARVLKVGGTLAVSVPRWLPERVCWLLSDEYHSNEGGHVRIYQGDVLQDRLRNAGLTVTGTTHAHALHSPYWWVKCAVGVHDDDHPLARAYHRLLVWDIMSAPKVTRLADRALNPVLGKSLVVYADKPAAARPATGDRAAAGGTERERTAAAG
jgi:SAM-dependent methyltransferase